VTVVPVLEVGWVDVGISTTSTGVTVGAGGSVGCDSPGIARVRAMKISGVVVAGSSVRVGIMALAGWVTGTLPGVTEMVISQARVARMNREASKMSFFMVEFPFMSIIVF